MFAYRRYSRWGRPRFAHVITWRLHVFIVILGGATMWPLAACQQKSPQIQHKEISDDQTDAAIVPVDSNYPTDSNTVARPWLMTWPNVTWRSREPTWHPRGPGCGLTEGARGDQGVRIGGTYISATRAPIGAAQSMGGSSRDDLPPTVKIAINTIIFALYCVPPDCSLLSHKTVQ